MSFSSVVSKACWVLVLPLVWRHRALTSLSPPDLDMRGIVSHNDVVYLSPARHGWEGLPLGNGRLGAQLWHYDGFRLQLNSSLSAVYRGAICRARLVTKPAMLVGLREYHQKLSLYDATVSTEVQTETGELVLNCFIFAGDDVLVLSGKDARSDVSERFFELETWRDSARLHTSAQTPLLIDSLSMKGEPDYRFAVAVGGGEPLQPSDKTARLRLRPRDFRLWLAFADTRDPDIDIAKVALEKLNRLRTIGFETLRRKHERWWQKFWEKSFIKLSSDDGVADYIANLWYMHIYAMGAGSRGEVPPQVQRRTLD